MVVIELYYFEDDSQLKQWDVLLWGWQHWMVLFEDDCEGSELYYFQDGSYFV